MWDIGIKRWVGNKVGRKSLIGFGTKSCGNKKAGRMYWESLIRVRVKSCSNKKGTGWLNSRKKENIF